MSIQDTPPVAFPQHIMSASKAIARYEAMSKRPRSSIAWRGLRARLNIAAAYAKYSHDEALANALILLAQVCRYRGSDPVSQFLTRYLEARK